MDQLIEGYRLSLQQRSVLRLLQRGLPCWTQAAIRFDGPIALDVVREALQRSLDRHEILRTRFPSLPGLPPVQSILPRAMAEIRLAPDTDPIDAVLHAEREAPFDIVEGPLARFVWVRSGADTRVLVVTCSALCADAASLRILAGEIGEHCTGTAAQADESVERFDYADYSEWQREQLERAGSRSTPDGPASGDLRALWAADASDPAAIDLPLEPIERLTHADAAATPSELLGTAWQVLQCRLWDIHESSPLTFVHGRIADELRALVGPMTGVAPVRCEVNPGLRWQELLALTRSAWPHAASSEPEGATDRVGAVVIDEVDARGVWRGSDLRVSIVDIWRSGVGEALRVCATQRAEGWRVTLTAPSGGWDTARLEALGERLVAVLASAAADPATPVRALGIGSARETAQLRAWNATPAATTDARLVAERMAGWPADRAAVIADGSTIAFGTLTARARQIARWLRRQGVGVESRVAVALGREPALLETLVGIWTAGAAAVVLEPSDPAAWQARQVAASGARWGIGHGAWPVGVTALDLDGRRDRGGGPDGAGVDGAGRGAGVCGVHVGDDGAAERGAGRAARACGSWWTRWSRGCMPINRSPV